MAGSRFLLVLVAAAWLAGCAVNPVSGRPEVTLLSAKQERELGREESKRVAESIGLVPDGALTAYVRDVGTRVAAHSPLRDVDYTFAILDMPEPNAFALPGGYVYVSRGLLMILNSEDELAGVLGHEIGHIAGRHAVQSISRAAPIGILAGLGAGATGLVSPLLGDFVGSVGSSATSLVLAPYGREQEREADRVGQELSAKAGWEPAALADALKAIEREDALSCAKPSGRTSFLATHPPLPERVASVRAHASEVPRGRQRSDAASREAFLRRLDGLVVGPNASDGVFLGRTFVHPDFDVALVFPEGWEPRNERDGVGAREPKKEATVVMTIAGDGDDPMAPLATIDRQSNSSWSSQAERIEIGGLPAVHLTTEAIGSSGPIAVDVTWIAAGGRIFCIVGVTRPPNFQAYADTFRATARTFRRPTAAERAGVRENRVRLVRVANGDTISSVLARRPAAWTPEMTRIANGIPDGEEPAAGRLLKVAVSERYARR
jgi:predicted Zn-dependent protease